MRQSWYATLVFFVGGCAHLAGSIGASSQADPGHLIGGEGFIGWIKVDDDLDYENSGEVSFRDGVMRLGTGGPMTGARWTGDFPTDDYEVELEARRVDGGDFFCGMTFPVRDSHATLILGGWGGEIVGISNVDGFAAVDNATTRWIVFENGRWYSVRLRVSGGLIKVWLDGDQIIEQPIEGHKFSVWPQQEPARPFGITTWRTTGEIRAIRLRRGPFL